LTRRRSRVTRPVLIAAALLVALPGAVALAGVYAPAGATSTAAAAPAAGTPHLDAVEQVLRAVSPGTEGSVWERTAGNRLAAPGSTDPAGWVLQTPGCWGDNACKDRSATTRLTDAMTAAVADATRTVDISSLAPLPDGAFQDAIAAGLRTAAAKRKIKVRVLVGAAPVFHANVKPEVYRDDLVARLGLAAANVSVSVASMTTSKPGLSWNHTKILVVDNTTAIVGGINDWKADYIDTTRPVTDLDLAVTGPAARSAGAFLDELWTWTCARQKNTSLVWLASTPGAQCPPTLADLNPKAPTAAGNVPVIAVGGLGVGIRNVDPTSRYRAQPATAPDTACPGPRVHDYTNADRDYETVNPEENALRALVDSATSHIEISQQDLNGTCPPLPRYDVRLYDALATKLAAGVKVRIVVSDPRNRGAVGSGGYSQIRSLAEISDTLRNRLAIKLGGDATRVRQTMCGNLQLASFQAAPDASQADGRPYALHHKLVAVDGAAFYLGSKNLYPVWLQDFGYIVEDGTAARQLATAVTDPQWTYSQRTATFDYARGIC
jgi:phosphatidylserine/phosphatidylglycerophosphate/cardiolipin synthase-like enzyme